MYGFFSIFAKHPLLVLALQLNLCPGRHFHYNDRQTRFNSQPRGDALSLSWGGIISEVKVRNVITMTETRDYLDFTVAS